MYINRYEEAAPHNNHINSPEESNGGKNISYRSMTVCLENSAGWSRRIEFALALAVQHDVHLRELHQTYAPLFPFDPYGQITSLVVEWEASANKKQEQAEKAFRAAAQKAGVNFDWIGY